MGSDCVQLALGFQQRRLHCHDVRRLRTYRMQPVQPAPCSLCSLLCCARPFCFGCSEEPSCGLVDSYHSRRRQLRTVPQLCSLSGSERGTDVCVRVCLCVCVYVRVWFCSWAGQGYMKQGGQGLLAPEQLRALKQTNE